MKMSEKFITTLIEVGREYLRFRLAFVLCTTSIPTMELFQHLEIFSMQKFNFCTPDPNQLKAIIKSDLRKEQKTFSRSYSNFAEYSEHLSKFIAESVRIVTTRIENVKEYLKLAHHKLIELNRLELHTKWDQLKKQGVKHNEPIPFDIVRVMASAGFR